jgi:hypothetical protein
LDDVAHCGTGYVGKIADVREIRRQGDHMSAILKFVSTAWASSSEIDSFFPVAIFCGIGMLASLLVLIFHQGDLFSAWN